MTNRVFKAVGGDGASLAIPSLKPYTFVSWVQRFPCGLICEVMLGVMTRARYRRAAGLYGGPHWSTVHAGPVVVVCKLTSLTADDAKWKDEIKELGWA